MNKSLGLIAAAGLVLSGCVAVPGDYYDDGYPGGGYYSGGYYYEGGSYYAPDGVYYYQQPPVGWIAVPGRPNYYRPPPRHESGRYSGSRPGVDNHRAGGEQPNMGGGSRPGSGRPDGGGGGQQRPGMGGGGQQHEGAGQRPPEGGRGPGPGRGGNGGGGGGGPRGDRSQHDR